MSDRSGRKDRQIVCILSQHTTEADRVFAEQSHYQFCQQSQANECRIHSIT